MSAMRRFAGLISRHRAALLALACVAAAVLVPLRSLAPPSLADFMSAMCGSDGASAGSAEGNFLRANGLATSRMMTGMKIEPAGDVDEDFVAMMVPHHQGAIDMALVELRYGHNQKLARIAQEIIVTQQQEIKAMRLSVVPERLAVARDSMRAQEVP